MKFSEDVRTARKQLNISQAALASELKVSFATVNRWEGGRTEPQPAIRELFYQFCKRKKVDFDK
ncbi:MAG: helix-turn-helix domain-containing protein [Clostridiales bacterium]|jgi:DNA-binding transcriptional regulator YiaG|nr:helix-turn-helix domain-containing protein [Clostridiales bacterium]